MYKLVMHSIVPISIVIFASFFYLKVLPTYKSAFITTASIEKIELMQKQNNARGIACPAHLLLEAEKGQYEAALSFYNGLRDIVFDGFIALFIIALSRELYCYFPIKKTHNKQFKRN